MMRRFVVGGLAAMAALLLAGCFDGAVPPAPEAGVVEDDAWVSGVRLHTVQSGAGRDLVLLHGLGGSHYTWRPLRAHLSGHRVTAVDLMGFGDSDKPEDERYTYSRQAELVSELIRRMRLRDYVLVGHSYGGGVAMQTVVLLRENQRARLPAGLVLMDTVAYRVELPSHLEMLRQRWLAGLIFDLMPGKWIAREVLQGIYHDDRQITPELINAYAWYNGLPGAANAVIETGQRLIPPDLDELTKLYPTIDVPALVIWGEQDRLMPVAVGEKLAKALPQGRLEVIGECGHDPMEEQVEETAGVVRGFLEGL